MKLESLCLALVHSESEEEVIKVLQRAGYWDRQEDWRLFGDMENNYGIIGGQQSKPESALAEKITNSIDAVLMRECRRKGIAPDGIDAPKSIPDALEKFFDIKDGKLTNLKAADRSKMAENIGLVATGRKDKPNITMFDKGEGQSPAQQPNTLLSLAKSNKIRIPFVQGKFNQGGTGVFRFLSGNKLMLIISKRDPVLASNENDATNKDFGFTIIRRETGDERSSSYKYLAPGGQILHFLADALPILPSKHPNAFGGELKWGTFIKMFNYQLGGLKTNILFELNYKLASLLPQIALPIKLYERRDYEGHSLEAVLSGLSVRVEEDRSDNIEQGFPATGSITVKGQTMPCSIYAFKKGKQKKYKTDEGIIFTVNGQTHGYISKLFFSRKNVGLNYLSDSLLVILDCSGLQVQVMEDLFMTSRDRLSSGPLKSEIERELEEILRQHKGLAQLKDKRRKEQIESNLSDQQPLAKVLQDILKNSPSLSQLFIQGLHMVNPSNMVDAASKETFKGSKFPTFFALSTKYSDSDPKKAHLNSKFRVEFKTDVRNDYFDRNSKPGTFKLFLNGKECNNKSINLWDGSCYLNIPLNGVQVGDILHFKSEVTDATRSLPFTEEFFVLVEAPLTKSGGGGGGTIKNPAGDSKGKDSKKAGGFSLPNIVEVSEHGRTGHSWEEQGFTKESALAVKGSEAEGYDFFVNVDNKYLLAEINSHHHADVRIVEAKYKFGLVLIGLALLNEYNNKQQSEDGQQEDSDIYKTVEKVSCAISPVMLPMINALGALEGGDIFPMMVEEAA
jgi:hypothetical protein